MKPWNGQYGRRNRYADAAAHRSLQVYNYLRQPLWPPSAKCRYHPRVNTSGNVICVSLSLLLYCTCLLWYGKRCKAKYYASPSLSSNTWLAPWQFWTNSIILIHICAELSSAGVGRGARALHVCATMEYVWNSSLVSLNLIVFATAAAYSYASRQWVPATTKLFKWQLYARSKKLTPRRASRPPFSERKQKALQSYYSHPPSHYRMHLTVRRDKCGHGQRRPAPRRYTAPARLYWHFSGSSYL